jgi:hypothetical protein
MVAKNLHCIGIHDEQAVKSFACTQDNCFGRMVAQAVEHRGSRHIEGACHLAQQANDFAIFSDTEGFMRAIHNRTFELCEEVCHLC